jgi:hypothetical protein
MVKKRIEQIDTALDTGADILSCYNPMSENNNQSELNFYVCTHGEFIPCIEINHYGVPNQLYGRGGGGASCIFLFILLLLLQLLLRIYFCHVYMSLLAFPM